MRGRNRSKGPNPLTRSYESNGPDVKIRGTAQHVADKYAQLARDAQASGDPVSAENYLQHAEHYYRLIAAAQEQFRQQYGTFQRPFDEDGEEGDEEAAAGYGYAGGERQSPEEGGEGYNGQGFPNGDRGGQQPRFDRQGQGERQDRGQRFDRGDRGDRGDRFERGGQDRPDRNGQERNAQDRGAQDRGGQDRMNRGDRRERYGRNGEQRRDYPRQDRLGRDDQVQAPVEESEAEGGNLPAFLTNPVRQPIAVGGEEFVPGSEAGAADHQEGEFNGGRTRRRTRSRRPSEDGEPLGEIEKAAE